MPNKKPNTARAKGRNYDTRFAAWMSEAEFDGLQQLATENKKSKNEIVRCLIRQALANKEIAQGLLAFRD